MAFKLYTCKEVAKLCGVSIRTVWSWIQKGELMAQETQGSGKEYRVRDDILAEFQVKHFPKKNKS